jgi:WD40 repeat protein
MPSTELKYYVTEVTQVLSLRKSSNNCRVKSKPTGGEYFSGGEDRTIRVWTNNTQTQVIAQPGTVWNIAINDEGDIIVASSDATIRTFTQNPARRAT